MHVTSLHFVPLKSNSSRLSLLWFATEVVVVACADLSSGGELRTSDTLVDIAWLQHQVGTLLVRLLAMLDIP